MLKSPGKIIGAVSDSGAMDVRDFVKKGHALLYNCYAGQEYAKALMNIIFGRVNPSGKLSFTIGHTWKEE